VGSNSNEQRSEEHGRLAYDAEKYWAERYSTIDITKSGHIDLPADYNKWLYERKKEVFFQGLKAAHFNPVGASVLEIATGTGVYVEAWQKRKVSRLVGIDISAAAVAELQRRFPKYEFYKRDLAKPGLVDVVGNGFDVVTAIDMLYHIVQDSDFPIALRNIAETVKPGGLFAIHDLFLHTAEYDAGYIKLRTLDTYRAALDAAGFDIVWRKPTFFFAVQPRDVSSPPTLRLMLQVWDRFTYPLIQRLPNLAGRSTYWTDKIIGAVMKEGPSFEMMICRRRAG
jgi:2-polyprenyl-3-methyl-5-hydroxy-6-metoxy-1,4-benzoquinol methylase